jgi:hypothetical protein
MENLHNEEQQRNEVVNVSAMNISDMFGLMIEAVRNGQMDALELYTKSKEISDIASKVQKEVQELAIEEAENRTEKTFNYGQYKVTKVEGRRMIDYSDIEEWAIAKANLKEIEDKYKHVALSSVASLDENTGEILKRPIITFSKTSITIK